MGVVAIGCQGCLDGREDGHGGFAGDLGQVRRVDARHEHEHERHGAECRTALACPPLAAPERVDDGREPPDHERALDHQQRGDHVRIQEQREARDAIRADDRPDREHQEHERRQGQQDARAPRPDGELPEPGPQRREQRDDVPIGPKWSVDGWSLAASSGVGVRSITARAGSRTTCGASQAPGGL